MQEKPRRFWGDELLKPLTSSEFKLEELSRHRFEKLSFDKAILVTGATENHAYHLPMGTDTYVAYAIAQKVARMTPGTLLLPPIPFGVSDQLLPYPFTITLTPETLSAVIFEAVESCVHQGITHFLIINGHGGNNSAIDVAMRKLHRLYPATKVAVNLAWWISGPKLAPEGTFGPDLGIGHAGEAETSAALYVVPHLVDMSVARGEWPSSPREVKISTTIPETSRTGATGDPSKATAEKGRALITALAEYLARFLKEMDKVGWNFAGAKWEQLAL